MDKKADRLLFESLGYTDKDQFDRFNAFIEKGPFNDLDPSIVKLTKIEPKRYGRKRNIPQGYEIFNEDWALSPTGDMFNVEGCYDIYDNRLNESGWILHLMDSKYWFDANTFIPAYFEACKRAGIKYVKIRTFY